MKMINNPLKYKPNNIIFRISSSKSLEMFKNIQNFVLSEMQYGKYNFSRVSKEIALLYTDSAFKVLLQIEQLLVRNGSENVEKENLQESIDILERQIDYMFNVVKENSDIFDEKFVSVWKKIHLPLEDVVYKMIENGIGKKKEIVFTNIASIFSDSIDAVRFELYELDYIYYGKKENRFLVVTDLCEQIEELTGVLAPERRARIYMEMLNVSNNFSLKNYTESYFSYIKCAKKLLANGINLTNITLKDIEDVFSSRKTSN